MDRPVSAPPSSSLPYCTAYWLRGLSGRAAFAPSTSTCPSSLGPAPPRRCTGASIATPCRATSASSAACRPGAGGSVRIRWPSEHVGGVADRALARVVDQRVLPVQRVRRDDPVDEVFLPRAVQRQAEPAAVHLAALGDERRDLLVDVVLAGERRVAGGGEAAGGQAVQRAWAVEVDRRLEALPQRPGGLQDRDAAHRRLVRDAVHEGEVALAVLGPVVGEDLGAAVDRRTLRQRRVLDLLHALLLKFGQIGHVRSCLSR